MEWMEWNGSTSWIGDKLIAARTEHWAKQENHGNPIEMISTNLLKAKMLTTKD